jgi:hypothetical protein
MEKVANKIQKVARTYYVNQEIYTIFARSDELLVINNRHLLQQVFYFLSAYT